MNRHPAALLLVTAAAACCCCSSGCKLPDVNLATKEPLKVDISVRLDVYNYNKDGAAGEKKDTGAKSVETVGARRRNRLSEVNELKNSRLVGEGHRGLLVIRDQPAGTYGQYVKKTVDEENDDRVFLMAQEAKAERVPLDKIQEREWKLNQDRALPGEWIEAAGSEPNSWTWQQKAKN